MRDPRPKNLNLFTIRFPIPAIVSITHRVSGIILFLLIPALLWILHLSLSTEDNYLILQEAWQNTYLKIFIWLCLIPYLFHLFAGIRHLIMDLNIGVNIKSGRFSAWLTFIITAFFTILLGFYLW